MIRRLLPNTDLEISVVGFGCWAIGKTYWGDDVDDGSSKAAIRAAIDVGINWFDTAPLYGEGHADRVLVDALGPDRHKVVIASKVGVRFGSNGEHARSDLSPSWVIADAESSLRRLQIDCIDLLQVHWPCEVGTSLDDTLEALERLRASGKIRHYGLCNYDADSVTQARAFPGMVSLQTPYSLLRREFESTLRPTCNGMGVVVYEPLCRGLLTGKYKSPPRFPDTDMRSWDERFQGARFRHAVGLVRDLERVASRLNVPTSAVSIGWTLAQEGVTAAIAGAKRPEQVIENARASEVVRNPKAISVIDKVAAIHGGW
ncbi:MAG: aldo/keto reductase [Myxococcota bacterium]|nr:aldo/keto reductase [Myxococcota bacterium]